MLGDIESENKTVAYRDVRNSGFGLQQLKYHDRRIVSGPIQN
jgi:hypothetical protein